MTKPGKNSVFLVLAFVVVMGNYGCKKTNPAPGNQTQVPQGRKTDSAQVAQNNRTSVGTGRAQRASVQTQNSSAHIPRVTSLDFTTRKDPFKPYIQPSKLGESKNQAEARPSRRGEDLLPIQTY